MNPKFWEFSQNNSGGHFVIDDKDGIGPRVWFEADSLAKAIDRALAAGIYFNGVASGSDCDCCGDRWHQPWDDDGKENPVINDEYDFSWHDTVYVHKLDGKIQRIKSKGVK